MIKLKYLLLENTDYDAAEDFFERRDKQLQELAQLLKQSKGKGRVPWKTVSASLLKKVWFQFGKYKRINENDLDKIADQILTNIARLQASTEMMGHTEHDVRPEIEDSFGIVFTDKEWEDWMSNYFTNKHGGWLLSDYGLKPLLKLYSVIFNADTPEEKLYACDKVLNVIHRRGDLADMFVEGGSATLRAVANQGGYSYPGDYGSVNREFREESLNEINDTSDWYYWWMDPNLNFHPVEHEGHAGFAIHHLMSMGINPKGKDHYYLMYNMGWVRVGIANFQHKRVLSYNYNHSKPLTDRQHRALNNWAKEHDCQEMRDNTKGKWEFIDEALEYPMAKGDEVQAYAGDVDWKGKIIWMTPDKFLKLAAPIHDSVVNKYAIDYLEKRFKEQLPTDFLVLEVDMVKRKVTGHEGRHRAMVAKKMGIEKVPVLIYTGSGFERVPKWDKATHDVVDKANFLPQK